MARAREKEVAFDAGEAGLRRRSPLMVVRGLVDWVAAALFFAVVSFAALPMGANRDWAWAPIAVMIGVLAVVIAMTGQRGFEVGESERKPLIVLAACFAVFVLFGLLQMSTLAPLSGSAWL